jgi:hypothetical protein
MLKSARLRYMTAPTEGTPGGTPPTTGTPAAAAPATTFTQDQVSAIGAREKSEGRTAALREVSDKLGGLSLDDAAALIEAARKADEANQTQAQRDAAAAATAKADADRLKAEAAADRHAARVERLLTGAVDVEVASRALDVEVGADDATIKAAIDALKTKVPGLFGAAPAAPHTDPSKPPQQPPAAKTAQERADAVAAARGYAKPTA